MTTKKMIMIMILLSSTYLSSSRSALLLSGKTTLMVSILIKQKLLISAVLDALEYQISQEKRRLEPTPHPRHKQTLCLGQLLWVNSRMSKDNTLSYQLQANNNTILYLWNIPNPSYDTKCWVTSSHAGNLNKSAQFKVTMSFNGCLHFNTWLQ